MPREILIVDDSGTIRLQVKILLKAYPDLHLREAENGELALEKLREHSVDLVLTDLNMPVLDGFGLIEAMRKLPHLEKVTIVVMTTREADADVERAFALGATAFLNKPLKKEDLLQLLDRHLGVVS